MKKEFYEISYMPESEITDEDRRAQRIVLARAFGIPLTGDLACPINHAKTSRGINEKPK